MFEDQSLVLRNEKLHSRYRISVIKYYSFHNTKNDRKKIVGSMTSRLNDPYVLGFYNTKFDDSNCN